MKLSIRCLTSWRTMVQQSSHNLLDHWIVTLLIFWKMLSSRIKLLSFRSRFNTTITIIEDLLLSSLITCYSRIILLRMDLLWFSVKLSRMIRISNVEKKFPLILKVCPSTVELNNTLVIPFGTPLSSMLFRVILWMLHWPKTTGNLEPSSFMWETFIKWWHQQKMYHPLRILMENAKP